VIHAGVVPQLAATVVLLRPGRTGLEVLLTRRPASMAFAPDMHVFPGGRVDAADGDPRLVARSVLSPLEAAAGLGGDLPPDVAIATYVAAIREVFEETGVLLADGGATGATGATVAAGKVSRAISLGRSALVGGDTDLATIAADLDGVIGARTIGGPADAVGTARSRARLATLVPGATWLSAHPA
jgi:NUDIX domain.